MYGVKRITGILCSSNLRRTYCTVISDNIKESTEKLSGFAKAYEKQSNILNVPAPKENKSFASLLRNSKLMDVSIINYIKYSTNRL